jgi:hypothetical protein
MGLGSLGGKHKCPIRIGKFTNDIIRSGIAHIQDIRLLLNGKYIEYNVTRFFGCLGKNASTAALRINEPFKWTM